MEEKIEEKKKMDIKVLFLSIATYYAVEIWLSIFLAILSSDMGKFYRMAIALIGAIYFYKTRSGKPLVKKDLIIVLGGALGAVAFLIAINLF